MSNNRFLKSDKSDKTNNRFQFLDEETEKGNEKKKDKKPVQYDSSNNSFMKPVTSNRPVYSDRNDRNDKNDMSNRNDRNDRSDRNDMNNRSDRNDMSNRNDRRDNHFKNSSNDFNKSNIPKAKEFIFSEDLFPDLIPPTNEKSIENTTSKFKDILNTEIDESLAIQKNIIQPGWIEISRINGKNIVKNNELTPYEIKMKKINELTNNPNYIMNTVITTMNKNRDKHIQCYDSIHGEGSYEELFVLLPVYDEEYEDDNSYYEEESDSEIYEEL
jgi:hypothetical protein